MSVYSLCENNGRLAVKRTRTDGLRFVLYASTDEIFKMVSYRAFKHFKVPSFKKHIINFAELKGEKKGILKKFFLDISFKDHAFNRNKSRAFVVGEFPSLESEDVLKVYILLRTDKNRYYFIRILTALDIYCVGRSYRYPSDYFAVAVINRLMIFVCRSMWCECSVHIDWYHGNQEITYFIHRKKLENGSIDVVIPRYLTRNKRYVSSSIWKPGNYVFYLSGCIHLCECIQTQLSYRKSIYLIRDSIFR